MKLLVFLSLILSASAAHAIKYYKNEGGKIVSIDAAAFEGCSSVIYSKEGSKGLSKKHTKGLVKATLKGGTTSGASNIASKVKSSDGACAYSEDSVTIQ